MLLKQSNHKGFTLFEILIVMSIVAILLVSGITNWKAQIQRSFDAQRKGDLNKLRATLEHYVNDHGCYPTVNQISGPSACGSALFAPYNMPKLVCDPEGQQPYLYELVDPLNPCLGYRLYTILRMKKDPDIERLGCDREIGCGVPGFPEYNYGVSSGDPIVQ